MKAFYPLLLCALLPLNSFAAEPSKSDVAASAKVIQDVLKNGTLGCLSGGALAGGVGFTLELADMVDNGMKKGAIIGCAGGAVYNALGVAAEAKEVKKAPSADALSEKDQGAYTTMQ